MKLNHFSRPLRKLYFGDMRLFYINNVFCLVLCLCFALKQKPSIFICGVCVCVLFYLLGAN